MVSMRSGASEWVCPAAALARSLLEVWISGDRYRLRLELERISLIEGPGLMEDSGANSAEAERIELLRSLARRMRESSELFAARAESTSVGTWLDLLDHLSATDRQVN
jgi:hypothetical protein